MGVEIPTTITAIGAWAFAGAEGMTDIEIPSSVSSIGSDAFFGCHMLSSVTFDGKTLEQVKAMENYSWGLQKGCVIHCTDGDIVIGERTRVKYTAESGLPDWEGDIVGEISGGSYKATSQIPNVTSAEEVELGTHVTSIGKSAFYLCTNLTRVTIPDSVTSIGFVAFTGCQKLTSITIPSSVTSIGDNVFSSCIGLTDVVIGNGVTSIGNSAFSSCFALSSITIPNSVTSIGYGAFTTCSALTDLTIPEGVESIGRSTFYDCTNLKNINSNDGVYLYDGIQTIGQRAFNNLGIEKLSFNNLAAMGIDSNAFAGCNQLTDVVVRGVTTHEAMSLENYPWGISNENIIRGDRGA